MATIIGLDELLEECRQAIELTEGASRSVKLRAEIITRLLDRHAPDFPSQWRLLEDLGTRQMTRPNEYPTAEKAGLPFEPAASGDSRAGLMHLICAHFNLVYADAALAS